MEKKLKFFHLLLFGTITLVITGGVRVWGQIPINYSGLYTGSITSDLASYRPTREPVYPDDYRVYGSSPTIWTNRMDITLHSGRKGRDFYFHLPFRIYIDKFNHTDETRRTYRPWNRFESLMVGLNGSKYLASIQTGRNLHDRDYGFIPFGALGNFKLATNNTGAIAKLTGSLLDTWTYSLYCLQPNSTRFIPYPEVIPQKVLNLATGNDGKGLTVDNFLGADEGQYSQSVNYLPVYTIAGLEGNGILQKGDKWGIYFGRKKVSNPGFRKTSADATVSRVLKYNGDNAVLGYEKDALEFNWQGNIKQSQLTIAGSISQANWMIYPENKPKESLGKAGGQAILAKLEKANFGPINITDLSYRYVAPEYQWVMARHPDYALVGAPIDPDDPASPFSYGMINDEQWRYRNPGRKQEYLSEISQFLGIQNFKLQFDLPGKILGKKSTFFSTITSNRWLDERKKISFWDHELDLVTNKDYLQVQSRFEIENSKDVLLKVQGLSRIYDQERNDRLESLLITHRFQLSNFIWETNMERRYRFLASEGLSKGTGYRFTNNLERRLGNKKVGFTVDLRHGNYDFGLAEIGKDAVTPKPYYYSHFQAYFKQSSQIRFGNTVATATLAGQIWNQKSDLAQVTTGTSYIGYGSIRIPWLSGRLVQDFTIISAKGPEEPQFPTGHIVNASDHTIRYNFENSSDTSFAIRTTYWPGGLGLEEIRITSASYTISLPRGEVSISYGRGNARRQGGTLNRNNLSPTSTYDGSLIPPLIIAGFPWDYWWPSMVTTRNPRIQYTNRVGITYTIRF